MSEFLASANEVFNLLEGTWRGEGRGGYPTVTSFDYREKLVFTRRTETTLAYEQRTEKRMDGTTEYITSHWENGEEIIGVMPPKSVLKADVVEVWKLWIQNGMPETAEEAAALSTMPAETSAP